MSQVSWLTAKLKTDFESFICPILHREMQLDVEAHQTSINMFKRIGRMHFMQKYSRISTWPQQIQIHKLPPLEKDLKSVDKNLKKKTL